MMPRQVLRNSIIALCCLLLLAGIVVWYRPLGVLHAATLLRLRAAGYESRYTQVDGYRIHYFAGGAGEPVVLIHGLGSRAEDWSSVMVRLARSRRVYAIDLLGYGLSERPRDAAYSIGQQASIVEDLMNSENIKQAAVIGWSMGGWIAARVALDQPERVSRLVLCDSAGIRFQLGFAPEIFEPDTPKQLSVFYALLLPKPVRFPDFVARDVLRRVRDESWVIRRSMQSMLSGGDLLDGRLNQLRMPVLIIWGKQDHLIPISVGEGLHEAIPNSQLEVFDGCGHLAPGQCADRVVPAITAFLDEEGVAKGR